MANKEICNSFLVILCPLYHPKYQHVKNKPDYFDSAAEEVVDMRGGWTDPDLFL